VSVLRPRRGQLDLRLRLCKHCGGEFWIHRRCDHGTSTAARLSRPGRARTARKARRKYRASDEDAPITVTTSAPTRRERDRRVGDHGSKKLTTPASVVAPDTEIAMTKRRSPWNCARCIRSLQSDHAEGPWRRCPKPASSRLMSILWLWHGAPSMLCVCGRTNTALLAGSLGGRAGRVPATT